MWKPIETAPKTDAPILIVFDNGEIEIVTDSDTTDWEPYDGKNENMKGISRPTHWMDLPAPPVQQS